MAEPTGLQPFYRLLEERVDEVPYDFNLSELAKSYLINNPSLDEPARMRLSWEFTLFKFTLRNDGKRFTPLAEFTTEDGAVVEVPSMDDLPDEAFPYFEGRLAEACNPRLRARYADILWVARKNHVAAQSAVGAYLDAAVLHLDRDRVLLAGDAMERAANIAVVPGLLTTDQQRDVRSRLLDLAERAAALGRFRSLKECALAFLALPEAVLDEPTITRIREILRIARDHYTRERHWNLERVFIELDGKIAQRLGVQDAASMARRAEAESYEKQAAVHDEAGGALVAWHFLEKALDLYRHLNDTEKVLELTRKRAEALSAARADAKPLEFKIDVPKELIDKAAALVLDKPSGRAALLALAVERPFLPSYELSEKHAAENRAEFPLQYLVPRFVQSEDRVIARAESEAELLEFVTKEQYLLAVRLYGRALRVALDGLARRWHLRPDDIEAFFRARLGANSETPRFIVSGYEAYSAGDAVSALHVWIPQVESLVRQGLIRRGFLTTWDKNGITREKGLEWLLRDPTVRSFLGDDLANYLEVLLTWPGGPNLRSHGCHGLAAFDSFSVGMADKVLHGLLILAVWVSAESDPPSALQPDRVP